MGKVIHWELCKRLKLDPSDKMYMNKPESVQEYETHEILWDLEIQTNHPIWSRQSDFVLINKKKSACHLVDFAVPADHRVKIKEKSRQILGSFLRAENLWNIMVIPIVVSMNRMVPNELEIRGRIKTIQTIPLLKSTRILRRVLEIQVKLQ